MKLDQKSVDIVPNFEASCINPLQRSIQCNGGTCHDIEEQSVCYVCYVRIVCIVWSGEGPT